MFSFFKRKQKAAAANEQPDTEFRRRTKALYEKFAIEDTPYDELLHAMASVEDEMNRNGGVNWNRGDYDAYLEIIREILSADRLLFSPQQLEQINWSLDEIAACGDELENVGESGRDVEGPIDYLIARVVEWCRRNEPDPPQDT